MGVGGWEDVLVKVAFPALIHKPPAISDLILSCSYKAHLVMEGPVCFAPYSDSGTQADGRSAFFSRKLPAVASRKERLWKRPQGWVLWAMPAGGVHMSLAPPGHV